MPGREEFPCNLSILLLNAEQHLRMVHGIPGVMCGSGEKFNSDGKSLRLNGKSTAQRDAEARERVWQTRAFSLTGPTMPENVINCNISFLSI